MVSLAFGAITSLPPHLNMTLLAGYQKVEMANLWVLLAICWSFITLIQAQQTPKNSLTATSLNVPLSSARYSLLSSTSSPSASLTKQKSISSKEELVLSGTYYHEALSPIATSSSTLNEIAAVHITATSTLAHLNGTKTAAHPHRPTNTQPCNQHIEFCKRSYGNITNVGTHNSPFVRENNAAANQHLDVTTQLDDGIRMRTYYPLDLRLISALTFSFFSSGSNSLGKWDIISLPHQVSNPLSFLLSDLSPY